MKKYISLLIIFFTFLSLLFAEIKVSYIGGNLSFSFVGSTTGYVEIKKEQIDTSKPFLSVVFGTMSIINDGDINFDVSLLISTETKGCRIVKDEPSKDKDFRFFTLFTDAMPNDKNLFDTDDILLSEKKVATNEVFAVPQDKKNLKGYDVEVGSTRTVYFRVDISTNVSQIEASFNLNITIIPSECNGEEITPSGGDVEIYNRVKLEIPNGALSENKEINVVKKDVAILPKLKNNFSAICAYELLPSGLVFRKPAKLTIFYKYDDIPQDKEDSLRIYFWDGVEWRYVGGSIDKQNKSVTAYISHFSIYALFPADEFVSYKPKEKIITPATKDGINDVATFDGLSGKNVEINIFDITGRRVRKINVFSEGNIWNGCDDYGNLVESGVYIYQFEVDGKKYSGTIIIAK